MAVCLFCLSSYLPVYICLPIRLSVSVCLSAYLPVSGASRTLVGSLPKTTDPMRADCEWCRKLAREATEPPCLSPDLALAPCQTWSDMVRHGQTWSGMVRHGQTGSEMGQTWSDIGDVWFKGREEWWMRR